MYPGNQEQALRSVLNQMGIRPTGAQLGSTLDALRKATFAAPASNIQGINAYNLEAQAKLIFNTYTPLRNMIPRVAGKGTGPNWRAVTKIDTARIPMGVPDGQRGAFLSHTVSEFTGRYAVIEAGSSSTFFAVLAAAGFDDLRAVQALTGLTSVQNDEERRIIGGLGTYGLAKAGTVTAVTNATVAGSLSTGTTYHVRVVALTADGYRLSVAPGATAAGQIPKILTVTSASPRNTTYSVQGFASQVSDDATGTTGGGDSSLDCTCAAKAGAVAYAWFIGSSSSNGTLSAITTVNKVTLKQVKTGGSPPTGYFDTLSTNFDADTSQNQYVFDGIFALLAKSGSGATITSLDGATLTSDNNGGIVEWDTMLKTMAQANLVSPSDIWFNFDHASDVASKISAGGTGDKTFHIVIPAGDGQADLQGGLVATGYKNKFALSEGDRKIRLHVHPEIPSGTMLFTSERLPPVSFPFANIPGVFQMETLEEYTQREYALIDMMYETGVSCIESLKLYTPFACSLLQNVSVG